jgi:spore coat protein CotF
MLRASFRLKKAAAVLKMEAVRSHKYVVLPFYTTQYYDPQNLSELSHNQNLFKDYAFFSSRGS